MVFESAPLVRMEDRRQKMKALLAAAALAALVTSPVSAHKVTKMAGAPSYLVYAPDGSIIGQDPDANVRLQMRRDFGNWEW
jgi:hypothetical protein